MRAVNFIGSGPLSKVLIVVASAIPQPPVELRRVSSTFSTVTFEWKENSDNGGAAVTDYKVYFDQGNSLLAKQLFVEAESTTYLSRQHRQSNLTKGNWYRFYVVAVNDAGLSEPSDTISLLAATVNDEPIDLRTILQTETVISLTWTPSSVDVGSAAQSYELQKKVGSQWETIDEFTAPSGSITAGLVTG